MLLGAVPHHPAPSAARRARLAADIARPPLLVRRPLPSGHPDNGARTAAMHPIVNNQPRVVSGQDLAYIVRVRVLLPEEKARDLVVRYVERQGHVEVRRPFLEPRDRVAAQATKARRLGAKLLQDNAGQVQDHGLGRILEEAPRRSRLVAEYGWRRHAATPRSLMGL